MAPVWEQSPGSNNCGVFVIAVCMAILLEEDSSEIGGCNKMLSM